MKYLKTTKQNIIVTISIAITCFIILIKSSFLDNIGMAAVVVMWLPIVFGIIITIFSLIIRYILKDKAWFVTVVGNVLSILWLISVLLEGN